MKLSFKLFPLLCILFYLSACSNNDNKLPPCLLTVDIVVTDVDSNNKRLEAIAAGGLEPYNYEWNFNTNQNSKEINVVRNPDIVHRNGPGRYVVRVTDVNKLCPVYDTVDITFNDCDSTHIIVTITSQIDILANYHLYAHTQGGATPYSYSWSNGDTGDSTIAAVPGPYSVTATDALGCTKTASITVACKRGCTGCNGDTTVTDIDGNVYAVVEIGNRCWMAENLRISAGIPEVTDSAQWVNLWNSSSPAWCYYNNNPGNATLYGKLYNGYAVDAPNICPQGWHIPTAAEWDSLASSLGGASVAGGAMKNTGTATWNAPNTGATNSSGMNVPGAGRRQSNSQFIYHREHTYFWSSTPNGADALWVRNLYSIDAEVHPFEWHKAYAVSCRCIKD